MALVVTAASAVGAVPRWQGLPHLVGLPPLDVIADIRFLLVHATGLPTFIAGVVVSVAVRSLVLASLLGGITRARVLFALRFYLVVLVPAGLAATLSFASMAVLYYLFFWLGWGFTVILAMTTGAGPWMGGARLRTAFATSVRRGFRSGTIGCYLALLTVLGAVADLGGEVGAVVVVPLSAALTWGAVVVLRLDPPRTRVPRRVVATVPAAGIVALAVVVVTGPAGPVDRPSARAQEGSIMLMSGVDSSSGRGAILEIDPAVMGWTCEQTIHFSYAGPGDGQPQRQAQCPIEQGAPYGPQDTLRSREDLVGFLEAQSAELDPPGVVVGHSQGAWLVWDAASLDRLPNTDLIVLVGSFSENRVTYPAAGEQGPGAVGRGLLGLLLSTPPVGGMTVFEPDSPLGHEWLAHPDRIERTLARPLPDGIRAVSVASAFDLPLLPGTHRIDGAVDACPVPVTHPNLPYAEELQEVIARAAAGEPLPGCPAWRTAIGPLFRHFAPPPSVGASTG
ncbi:MAG TPA: hypothetical protein VMN58_08375 [Acidimicrobiales bacterium]|nr:hypothetical protein [Acidimicrobiales bacterium]